MKFGLSSEQYQFILDEVVTPLKSQGAEVWCYGSRARGHNKAFSDLDLMVESDADLALSISQIQEKLSNSNFPYKVDLVEYRHFADSYIASYQTDKVKF